MTTEEIRELFNKITVPLDGTSIVKGMSFDAFHSAILLTEHKAFMDGIDQGMDKLMETVGKGLQTAGV
jgi:hypothetical protein